MVPIPIKLEVLENVLQDLIKKNEKVVVVTPLCKGVQSYYDGYLSLRWEEDSFTPYFVLTNNGGWKIISFFGENVFHIKRTPGMLFTEILLKESA